MKTITVRLTDKQAEALNRISYIWGMSKNYIFRKAITSYYEELEKNIDYTNLKDITDLTPTKEWPRVYIEEICNGLPVRVEEFLNAMKVYNYAIEHTEDTAEAEELIKAKEEMIKEYEAFTKRA